MLIGKNLVKKYHNTDILKDVSISIEPGKITSLIGPSGAGKTTLIRMLSMLELPDSGSIIFDDKEYAYPLKTGASPSPWPRISIVFQSLFLWPHLTLKQNILLPLKTTQNDYVDELISILQMGDFIDRYPNQVSLGQRQRVALARAFALKPEYLLLDEITSALDVEQINIILNYLLSLRKKGVGILLVTHLLNFAQTASDQIIFLDNGSVIQSGGKEIITKPEHPRIKKFVSIIKSAT